MVSNAETILGSACTGVNGAVNRTYVTDKANVNASTLVVVVNRSTLIPNTDYTFDATTHTITFIVNVFDINSIYLIYDYTTSSSSASEDDLRYTTILNFNKYMLMNTSIPNRNQSTFPDKEVIGTGDNSKTLFYFDHSNIIENSETLYYGASESAATSTLTRTTHYTIDEDMGKITLTSAGVTLLDTNKIYGIYSYNKYDIPNSTIKQALIAAESDIDRDINTRFYDGTAATPDFKINTNELHAGQGMTVRVYQTDEYPINNTTTTLDGAVSADDTTITVVSTQGFPTSGSFAVESDKISYTGKTATTFTGCTSVSAHATGKTVTSWVVEQSLDAEGNEQTYSTLQLNTDYSIDFQSGEIKLNNTILSGTGYDYNYHPPKMVWDRVRLTYQSGINEIPNDLILCTHMMAGSQLFEANVLNALARSTDGFETNSHSSVLKKVKYILDEYRLFQVKGIR